MANLSENGPRREPNRPVKPRKPRFVYRPIMAIDKDQVLLESGEVHPFADLPLLIKTEPSSILVATHFGQIIKYLDSKFATDGNWQFRASPVERSAWAPNRKNRQAVMKDCIIGYLGFKGKNKQKGHYHYPLTPHTFILKSVSELRRNIPGENANIVKLMEWAKEVRKFLEDNQLNLSPTSGGIAAQFLKDKRFYPNDRRKVPGITNAKTREHLPGNYYKLYAAKENKGRYTAAYLDQISAHHTAAKTLQFPCANTLYRKGRFNSLADRSFAKAGTEKFDKLISEYGLFYLAIETPRFFDTSFPLPECEGDQGYRRGYFYSNEIPYLKTLGVRIRHIIAAWTSPDHDPGLNRYAEWALDEIANAPTVRKPWLKPTLLSTYGVLAAKPKILEFGYKQAKGGEIKQYPCGSGFIEVIAKSTDKKREPLMANVLHRGMIEAETRLQSLMFARELAAEEHTILAIYADSIFVEGSTQLPLLRPPWRVQDFLTGLKFESATHFTSHQMSKSPGVPANFRDRIRGIPPRPRKRKASTQN